MSLMKSLFGMFLVVVASVALSGCKPPDPEPVTPAPPVEAPEQEETPAGGNLTNDVVEPSSNLTTEPDADEVEPSSNLTAEPEVEEVEP